MIDKKYRDTELPIFDKFWWFLIEVIKNVSGTYYDWLAWESILLIVTLTHDNSQVAAFSIFITVVMIMDFIVIGANVEPRNIVNSLLKLGKFR